MNFNACIYGERSYLYLKMEDDYKQAMRIDDAKPNRN